MHVLRGRDFAISDRPGAPNVAIVSKSLAEKFWPGEDPIGKRIGGTDPVKPDWSEVVGVVNDVVGSIRIARYETPYQIYRPWFQDTFRFLIFSVRTGADPHSVVEGARKALADVEPDIAATILAPARDTMEDNMSGIVLVQRMLDVMALLGLLLSTIGIYGVVANVATERTLGHRAACVGRARHGPGQARADRSRQRSVGHRRRGRDARGDSAPRVLDPRMARDEGGPDRLPARGIGAATRGARLG
jgi:hypothetical protein